MIEMFALFLIAVFALATVAAIGVLADSGLRWWSAFGMLRQRMNRGYASAPVGQRPVILQECSLGFARAPRARQVIRRSTQRAA
ncbi:hypothetical protein KUW15_06270 [Qipengyuania aquimaris]|uniref:hypothetical protein n=1 Tax=Qipengyuania aquimaris TaxID=255984 RepID=UPI001C95BD68|nr:hypothetical protein [Qipengyuania aquimaris]MBY6128313.1 hypothetical protein [Qipengyuania aquimaris]